MSDADAANVLEIVERTIDERTKKLERLQADIVQRTEKLEATLRAAMRTMEATKGSGSAEARLAKALRAIEEVTQRDETRRADLREVARNARIARAAQSAEMTVDEWLSYCRKRRRDPTLFLEVSWPRKKKPPKQRAR